MAPEDPVPPDGWIRLAGMDPAAMRLLAEEPPTGYVKLVLAADMEGFRARLSALEEPVGMVGTS